MADTAAPAPPLTLPTEFEIPPVRTRDLLLGSGPRLARDAFGPLVVFYVVWRLAGLNVGIVAATAAALAAMWWERRHERRGLMARIALAIVLLQAAIGLVTGSERLYLAQPVIVSGAYGMAFLGSVVIGRPLAGAFAEETYPFPDFVRESVTYRQAFSRISLVWGVYLVFRSSLRLMTLASSSVEAFVAVNLITGVPVTALLLSWSIWYGVRYFRRSEEWGAAIQLLDEMAAAGTPIPAVLSNPPKEPSMTDTSAEPLYNPFQPGFAADPYPEYAKLRAVDPVHETPFGLWLVFGYDDVQSVLRSRHVSVEVRNGQGPFDEVISAGLGDADVLQSQAMLSRDAPDHTRLRRLVAKVFTPNAIAELRPRIQQLVDGALDEAERKGELDLIADLAFPLPFTVISEMLGMPEVDRVKLREWSGLIVRTLEPIPDIALLPKIAEANEHMGDLIREVIEAKRRNPSDDLLSALIAAEDNGDVLSDDELGDQVGLLYIAGHETTVNLIGNGVLALMRNQDQFARLRDDESLDQTAIEELLRYDPPVQMTRRVTLADIEVGGRTIPAGTFVALVLASANRDREHFGDTAEALDLGRQQANQHVSFGGGIHHCLGAALARLEAQIAITTLVRRFPDLALAGEPAWNGRINLRGMDHLPLRT